MSHKIRLAMFSPSSIVVEIKDGKIAAIVVDQLSPKPKPLGLKIALKPIAVEPPVAEPVVVENVETDKSIFDVGFPDPKPSKPSKPKRVKSKKVVK